MLGSYAFLNIKITIIFYCGFMYSVYPAIKMSLGHWYVEMLRYDKIIFKFLIIAQRQVGKNFEIIINFHYLLLKNKFTTLLYFPNNGTKGDPCTAFIYTLIKCAIQCFYLFHFMKKVFPPLDALLFLSMFSILWISTDMVHST